LHYSVVVLLNFQLSQGSAATYLRWDGRIYSRIFRSSSLTATVKELLPQLSTNV